MISISVCCWSRVQSPTKLPIPYDKYRHFLVVVSSSKTTATVHHRLVLRRSVAACLKLVSVDCFSWFFSCVCVCIWPTYELPWTNKCCKLTNRSHEQRVSELWRNTCEIQNNIIDGNRCSSVLWHSIYARPQIRHNWTSAVSNLRTIIVHFHTSTIPMTLTLLYVHGLHEPVQFVYSYLMYTAGLYMIIHNRTHSSIPRWHFMSMRFFSDFLSVPKMRIPVAKCVNAWAYSFEHMLSAYIVLRIIKQCPSYIHIHRTGGTI